MARPIKFKQVQVADPEMNRLQDRLSETLDSVTSNPLLAGNLLSQVSLVAGSNLVSHGLGRRYITWLSGNASSPLSLSAGKSPDPLVFINVISDAPGSADILAI